MAIPKVIGTETEYGIAAAGVADFNPVLASSQLIATFAGALRRIRWDYEQESPLRDARGFEPVQVREPAEEDVGLANVILPNGARYYVDHAHPEYSTPECASARELVVHDKAGERILERSLQEFHAAMPEGYRLQIYKNNSDGKGNSYGTHENYLVDRATPFSAIVRDLTPFFVTRQVFTGAGKLGGEAPWDERGRHRYQLSQRADFFEAEVGLETTLKRPIINTRDEPHADPEKYRRLHVIVGDANLCEVATFLKVGTTALVLKMIEDEYLPDLSLANPVAALHEVSRDITCTREITLADGRRMTAVQIQWEYFERAAKYVEQEDPGPENEEILRRWEEVLTGLEADPLSLHRQLDWVAKYRLLEAYRERDGLEWSDPKLRLIDLQYHDVQRDRGLYHRLAAAGKVERLVTDAEIDRAVLEPPEDTRAYFRGRCVERFREHIAAASWDSIIFDVGREALQRVPMREPLRGTRRHVGDLLDRAPDPATLLELLSS
ncbi:MAG: proteasome accessory factor PafA2 [Actinomycetota bacterium]|nr:MAG: proteasome accessory factor PafA2 [Actinomycetota bacterium]